MMEILYQIIAIDYIDELVRKDIKYRGELKLCYDAKRLSKYSR